MQCPKCGKRLTVLTLKGDKWYSHTYSFAHAISDKPMCDYSKKIEPSAIKERYEYTKT